MALSSRLFTEASPGRDVLKRCSENHAGHLLRGMATNAAIKDAITRVQQALKQAGFPSSDPSGVYGAGTEAAVLKFKGSPRNILGPGQTRPDAIVGIQTIQRLDEAVRGAAPPPPAAETESTQWRFGLFGDKGFAGVGKYILDIFSLERIDVARFSMSEMLTFGDLVGGFRGESRGTFTTLMKLKASDFSGSSSKLFIDKKRATLTGSMTLNVSSKQFEVILKLPTFQEQRALGGALTSGTLAVQGFLNKE